MNLIPPDHDRLEKELAELQPRPLSDGFHEELGRRLSPVEPSAGNRRRYHQLVWAAAAMLAVAFLAVLGSNVFRKNGLPERESARPEMESAPRVETSPFRPQPTLLAYSRASTGAEEELNALLDYHAGVLLPRSTDQAVIASFE